MEETITLLSGDGQPVEGRICEMQERHWRDFQTLWQTMLVATDQPDAAWIGVGRLLLMFARRRRRALGYGGRVGLHSLPGAEGFYQHSCRSPCEMAVIMPKHHTTASFRRNPMTGIGTSTGWQK